MKRTTGRPKKGPDRRDGERLAGLLRALREKAGYPNARDFFEALGGRGHFGCTYRQYWNVEQGAYAPNPRLMGKIVADLAGPLCDPVKAREVSVAYLRAALADAALVDFILQSLFLPRAAPPAAPPGGPGR